MDRLDDVVAQLARRDFAVVRDFLPRPAIDALRTEQQALYARGLAVAAAIGRGHARQLRSDLRGDEILWLDPANLSPAQAVYWDAIEALRTHLNANLFLSLMTFEIHFARYLPGRSYARHLDVFQNDSRRMLSCSLYLNEDWATADGGALRLFMPDGGAREILPEAGTLVVFKSRVVPHEVLPATRPRYSITGWLKCR